MRTPDDSGFTLLELIVALSLTGLLLVLLFGGFRVGTRTWESSAETFDTVAELRAVQGLIRRQLNQVLPLTSDDGSDGVAFVGDERSLNFTSPAPAHLATGGLYRIGLGLSNDAEGRRLVMTWAPLGGGAPEEATLIAPIADAAFSYFEPEAGWKPEWTVDDAIPRLVRLRLLFPDDSGRWWPELIVAPMVAGGADDE